FEVPHGTVDRADRHHRPTLSAVDRRAIKRVPDQLVCERISSDEVRPELHVDGEGLLERDWTANADYTVVGLQFDEVRFNLIGAVSCDAQRVGPLTAIVRVDVHRPNEPLFPELTIKRHATTDLAQPDVRDPHAAYATSPAGSPG